VKARYTLFGLAPEGKDKDLGIHERKESHINF